MGIFSRIKALFSGFVLNATDNVESKNPKFLIKEAENKIQKSRKEAQKQLIEVQTWAENVRMDMREAELRLADVRVKIDIAAEENDKKLLTDLYILEESLNNEYEEHVLMHKSAVDEALRIRDNYKAFEAEMNNKLKLLENIKKQSEIMSIREKISNIDYRYVSESEENIKALRSSLNKRNAKLSVLQKSNEDNIDVSINNMLTSRMLKRAEAKASAKLIEVNREKGECVLINN